MTELQRFRAAKDRFFKSAAESPIRDRASFTGLTYFPEDPDLRFRVEPADADGSTLEIDTSDGQRRTYHRDKSITLSVGGETVTLTLYGTGHGRGWFLPFRDATNGKQTYGAGRYLDLEPEADGTVVVDFNLAYSPYCAYDDAYSCPLPPVENWLSLPIEAGETHEQG